MRNIIRVFAVDSSRLPQYRIFVLILLPTIGGCALFFVLPVMDSKLLFLVGSKVVDQVKLAAKSRMCSCTYPASDCLAWVIRLKEARGMTHLFQRENMDVRCFDAFTDVPSHCKMTGNITCCD